MTAADWAMVVLACLPLAAAVGAFIAPRLGAALGVSSGLVMLLAALMLAARVMSDGTAQHELAGWGAPLGIVWVVDGLAALMLVLAAGIATLCAAFRAFEGGQAPLFWPLWLFLLAGLNALFLSADLFNLFVALEVLTLAAVGLIALAGENALGAAWRYLLAMVLGSSIYLMGVALLYGQYGVLDLALLGERIAVDPVTAVAVTFVTVGLLLKSAVFPLHFWLPKAHGRAPTVVSAALSAIVIAASYYLLIRLWFGPLSGFLATGAAPLLGALGAGALLWGGAQALLQRRLKMLIAYSTVSQIGFGMLVFPLAATASGTLAWSGAVLLMVAHSLAKAALFLGAGCVIKARGSDAMSELGTPQRGLRTAWIAMAIACASLIGLPPTGGFTGKLWLLQAAIAEQAWVWVVIILTGTLLTAAYLFRMIDVAARPRCGSGPDDARPPVFLACAALGLAVGAVLAGIAWPAVQVSPGAITATVTGHASTLALLGFALAAPWLCMLAVPRQRALGWVLPLAPVPALLSAMFTPEAVHLGSVGVDAVTRLFLIVAATLWSVAGWFAVQSGDRPGRHPVFALAWLAALAGNLTLIHAQDLLTFYVGMALMTFASYGLIIHSRQQAARAAGRVYVAMMMLGEVAMMLAIAMLMAHSAPGTPPGFAAPVATAPLAVALLAFGFAMKLGVFGVHAWLPLAHPVAPVAASAVLSGVMIKAGALGWWRISEPAAGQFPEPGVLLVVLGLLTALYGAARGVMALAAKTVLAWSSVSQMGLMVIMAGVALTHTDAAPAAYTAMAALVMHHGLNKGALFLGAGLLDADSGPQQRLVWRALWLPALALAGAPLTSGALSKAALDGAADLSPLAGWLSPALYLAAVATTLLMMRFLWCTRATQPGHDKPMARAPLLLWLTLVVAATLLPWTWFRGEDAFHEAWTLSALTGAAWPVLLGLGIAALALRGGGPPQLRSPLPALTARLNLTAWTAPTVLGISNLERGMQLWSVVGRLIFVVTGLFLAVLLTPLL
ncbi:proton-conducting transporter membrane subunit [Aquisalimonas asiatica]|uniref:Formate hydrogenlyase subunit 3/Multisubunit Na+/H+ antiporter, MnhD subunit n=1 Tax=Aquisalimonas asiatica TaxID=406100 RepID=A0A1H8PXH4_9GAMM|nr:proton-conducting transporter membrane subunit [Aquisalimonas asiatica]SEO46712.1 Formate hydrogenlyase subunit 3/Multisubunit Na+/H+ antiporter, MnhD subunit [Aquisalimonas asiatica]